MFFCVGIIMYLYAKPSFIVATFFYPEISPFYRTVFDSWCVAVGSIILIVFAISSNLFSKILSFSIVKYYGKISYSLYLSHIFILLSMFQLLYGHISTVLICVICLILTTIVSGLMYRYIEEPSIKLGRSCSNKIKQLQGKRVKRITETV